MTTFQKIIKFAAIALAILIIASIISTIISIAAGIFDIFDYDEPSYEVGSDAYEYEFDASEISSLDIELEAASLTIKRGDALTVFTNKSRVNVTQNSDVLQIEESSSFNKDECVVTLTIPELKLEEADIDTGAGILNVRDLCVNILEIDLGAGESYFDNVSVSESADINGGAGNIEISNCSFASLDFDIGMGNVEISAYLLGNSDIDCGVGALDMTLLGKPEDYSIDVNKGIGDFRIGESSVPDGSIVGSGDNRIKIDSGIGDVNVEFEEQ